MKYKVWKEEAASEAVAGVFSYIGTFDSPKGLYPAGEAMRADMEVGDCLLLVPNNRKRGAGIVRLQASVEVA